MAIIEPPPQTVSAEDDEPDALHRRITRRDVLRAAGGAVVLGGAGLGVYRELAASPHLIPAPMAPVHAFRSRPDLRPATTTVVGRSAIPGYLFIGPGTAEGSQAGPLIVGADGQPVWYAPAPPKHWLTNFRVQRYRGQPVLTWWEGVVAGGYGEGEGVIADTSYREITRVRAVHGHRMDLHELQLTDAGTALFTCHPRIVDVDLSPIGGPSSSRTLESIFQEVDIATGRLLLEWRSLDHVPVSDSLRQPSATFDYFHINSIDVMIDGNLLISARDTWAAYKLDRRRGEVIWRLGGKGSQFEMDRGSRFAWQHDARQIDARTMTIFDDGFDGVVRTERRSRGLALDIDVPGRRVRLAHAYRHQPGLSTPAMGNAQRLGDGHMVLGWGDQPFVTEFNAHGDQVADLRMSNGQHSYRGFRLPWSGSPTEAPALAATREPPRGRSVLYASWNGATALTRWRIYAGARASDLRPIGTARRRGFETRIELGAGEGYAAVAAVDASGDELRRSATIRL